MNTFVLNGILYPNESISTASKLLQNDNLIAFPTETVYGLGACVFNTKQVQKIFETKGRPSDNPLIVHISSIEAVHTVASMVPDEFYTLAKVFFPGPLTIVLPKKKSVPDIVSAGLPSVAVRMPKHSLALSLITKVGQPLVAPSANISGKPSPTTALHVLEDFDGKISAVLDGGSCSIGIESTVLSLLDITKPMILRPGSISKQSIESVLGKSILFATGTEISHSPGTRYRHYSPNATISLTKELSGIECNGTEKVILTSDVTVVNNTTHRLLSTQTLYSEFRRADTMNISEIVIVISPDIELNVGLLNRIEKAVSRI